MHHSQRCLLILDSQPVVINRRVDNNHRNKVKAEGPGNGCRNLRAGTISTSQYKSVQANTNQHKHGVSAPTPAGLSRPATRCLTRIFYPPVDFVPGLFIKHSITPKNTPPFPKTLRHSRDSNSSPRLLNEYNPAPGRSLYLLVARIHVRFYPERWQTPNLRHYLPP